MLIIYLISIIYYVFAFMKGFNEPGFKSKLITIGAVALSGYNLYNIFTQKISDSLLINILLTIIPGIIFLFGLLFTFTSSSKSKPASSVKPQKNQQTTYHTGFQDNDIHPIASAPTLTPEEDPLINFKNSKIDGYGFCDVEETPDYIKITMRADGNIFDFYVQNGNIVSYRTEKMKNHKDY